MGNLSTPNSVQKLQTALHAKAKAEPGYRFYALYDKISREDILAHAYAQCRSNKGAPGVDRQDFEDIEAYGVERWLGELALALRQETYRPDPIRRVFIPKANGKLRPLGISTLRDRVCMTAAMLVLEPIFEADLPIFLASHSRVLSGRSPRMASELTIVKWVRNKTKLYRVRSGLMPSSGKAKVAERRRSSLLQLIYAQFTEGFDTADLRHAKLVMDSLKPRPDFPEFAKRLREISRRCPPSSNARLQRAGVRNPSAERTEAAEANAARPTIKWSAL